MVKLKPVPRNGLETVKYTGQTEDVKLKSDKIGNVAWGQPIQATRLDEDNWAEYTSGKGL
jgi:hypothetical protein